MWWTDSTGMLLILVGGRLWFARRLASPLSRVRLQPEPAARNGSSNPPRLSFRHPAQRTPPPPASHRRAPQATSALTPTYSNRRPPPLPRGLPRPKICRDLSLYSTPELNDKIYLHYKGQDTRREIARAICCTRFHRRRCRIALARSMPTSPNSLFSNFDDEACMHAAEVPFAARS
jgi:hypothetical protein